MKNILLLGLVLLLITGCSSNLSIATVSDNTSVNIGNLPLADRNETVSVNDYFIEVGRGGISDAEIWNKFGYNEDIDTGTSPEVIRSWGGSMDLNMTPQLVDIVSSSSDDSLTGSGLQLAIVYGVNGSWEHVIEVVSMDGTNTVQTAQTYIGINRLTIFRSGDDLGNVGTITATGALNNNIMGEIPVGEGTSQQCMFYVGENKRFEAMWLYLNAIKTSGGGQEPELDFEFWVYSDIVTSKFVVFRSFLDVSLATQTDINPNQIPFNVGEKSVIWVEGTTDVNNARATCRFSGVLVDD